MNKWVQDVGGGGLTVCLEPDVAAVFPDSGSVNEALALVRFAQLKSGDLIWKKYSELYPYINSRAITHTGIQGQ